jgi:hypothetical protein
MNEIVRRPITPPAAVTKNAPGKRVAKIRPAPIPFNVGDDQRMGERELVEPPIGAVIKVTGEHLDTYGPTRGKRYDYAIIRANNGRWYTTGSSCPYAGYDWNGLKQFLLKLGKPVGKRLI